MELKIDTERHLHGAEVASELRGERGGGIPWMLITDSSGAELVTSDGPQGNVGCPVMPHETEWFLSMLGRTRQHLTDEEFAALGVYLEEFALQYRR